MRLLDLIIKNFGKFSSETWTFREGINVIYGENESGKSTLYTFIKSMLFGMERGRGKASRNDTFSQYEPWENPNFYAGILKFECGGRIFRLERNFDKYSKNAVLICEDDGEELSLEQGDLEMLLDGMTADGYENTIAVGQLKVETNQSLAAKLQDYATNYYATGNGELHLEAALNHLKNKKKEIEKLFREELIKQDRKREKITLESSYIWRDIHKLEQKIEEIDEKIDTKTGQEKEVQEKPRWRVHPLEIIAMLMLLIVVFVIAPRPWDFLLLIVGGLAEGIYIWNRMKEGTRKKSEIKEIGGSIERLNWEKEHLVQELKEKQIQHSNMEELLEEFQEANEERREWERKQQALDMAAKKLTELSVSMQKSLGQELNEKTSEIIEQITGGKYNRLIVDETLHISLLTEDKKIPVERVSRGTIEQIYFALRMAAVDLLHEEEFPVILDDTFVFYDEKRLENTLKWLAENKKQVILFTCQKREQELLEKLHIAYHTVEW